MGGSYGGFAALYDSFMAGTDYDGWVDYIEEIFKQNGVSPRLLLELGCGTGSATTRFKNRGYDIIGLDSSPDMLAMAKRKDGGILYINQDMREFELYGTVDAVISLCDAMNYILTKKGLADVFRLVENYLNPGGLFIFDMNTPHKYRRVLGNRVFAGETAEAAFIWRNTFFEKERLNEYRLTFFRKRGDGFYERFRELHRQRAYARNAVVKLLEGAGLALAGVYGEKTFLAPRADEERVFFVARKAFTKTM